ncbi:MAG: LytTR family DNA-binding domain-containing protein [Lachnospiraceae bacterium]|nr:LytTR family DNA-binding domain-containing protein [Lachnospiraceae bacterium]
MNNLIIGICDDEKEECAYLQKLLNELLKNRQVEFHVYQNGASLCSDLNSGDIHFSMIFLDIYLENELGIDIAKQVKKIDKAVPIIFITTSRDFAVEAFSVRAFHYLVKPVTVSELKKVLDSLLEEIEEEPFIQVQQGHDIIRVWLKNICYLQSDNKVVHIMNNKKDIVVNHPLKEIEVKLSSDFLKIQRGFIVNMDYISHMKGDSCVLKDGRELLISRTNRSKIRQIYKEFIYNRAMEEAT